MGRSAVLLFYLVTVVAVVVQIAVWYPALPAEVPGHFDGNGRPTRWDSKESFVLAMALVQAGVLFALAWLGYLVRFVPVELVNVPNREYWLSGERRADTLGFLQSGMLFVGALTSWLLIGIFQLSANVAMGNRLDISPDFWVWLGLYLFFVAVFVLYLWLRFRKPDETNERNWS